MNISKKKKNKSQSPWQREILFNPTVVFGFFFNIAEKPLGKDSAGRREAASTNDKYFGKTETPYVLLLFY